MRYRCSPSDGSHPGRSAGTAPRLSARPSPFEPPGTRSGSSPRRGAPTRSCFGMRPAQLSLLPALLLGGLAACGGDTTRDEPLTAGGGGASGSTSGGSAGDGGSSGAGPSNVSMNYCSGSPWSGPTSPHYAGRSRGWQRELRQRCLSMRAVLEPRRSAARRALPLHVEAAELLRGVCRRPGRRRERQRLSARGCRGLGLRVRRWGWLQTEQPVLVRVLRERAAGEVRVSAAGATGG
jgi:hypothetical protein